MKIRINDKKISELKAINILYVVLCIVILAVLSISLMVSTRYFFHLEGEEQLNLKEWISLIVTFLILLFIGGKMFKK